MRETAKQCEQERNDGGDDVGFLCVLLGSAKMNL